MTDHQQDAGPVAAPEAPASTQDQFKAALFSKDDAPEEQVSEEASEEAEVDEPVEGDLTEADFEEEGEEAVEGESPIKAPVSLNAEEKEAFGQLPPEAQSFVTALEARRNADVTKVTTKAADAQRAAEAQAAQAAIQAKQEYAQQLNAFVQNFAPQMPDPALAQTNPGEYIALKAQYDAQAGQFQQLKHQIDAIGSEAQQEAQANFIAQRDKALMQIPEIANEETRQTYLDRVFDPELVQALGFERSELAAIADADDVKRLNTIADWREKAAKYDKAMSRKMKHVRQGKARASKPSAAQQDASSSAEKAFSNSVTKLKSTGSRKDAQAAFKAVFSQ